MSDRPAIDDFHRHEVLHTASVIADMFERHIVEHIYTQAEPALKDEAERVAQALHDFYQLVGRGISR